MGINPSKGKAPFFLPLHRLYEFTQKILHYLEVLDAGKRSNLEPFRSRILHNQKMTRQALACLTRIQ